MKRISSDLMAILIQAQANNPTAIRDLYTLYGPSVQRYCYARLGTVEAAEDCTQETFIRVWKHIPAFEYRGEPSFISWLYTIANHVVIRYIRTRQHTEHVALTPDFVDGHRSDIAHSVCEHVALVEATQHLTVEQQQVIALKFFDDLSNIEIAAVVGRTESAVKALQRRALQRLHSLLNDEHTKAPIARLEFKNVMEL